MFETQFVIKFYKDRGIPKKHVYVSKGKYAVGKIVPVFDKVTKKFAECEYCQAIGGCP